MDPRKEQDEELIFYEIQDQSMSFGNAIIIMILFGLIGIDIDWNNFTLTVRASDSEAWPFFLFE